MIREVVTHPDPVLREQAALVAVVDQEVKDLIRDMFETIRAAPGIGLAAPQLGVSRRVLVIDLLPDGVESDQDREYLATLRELGYTGPVALVNPTLEQGDGEFTWEEGCLSLPEVNVKITRCEHVIVTALDREGQPLRIEAAGLFAVAIQHEMDHLNGKLIIDFLPASRQEPVNRRLKKLKNRQRLARQQQSRC